MCVCEVLSIGVFGPRKKKKRKFKERERGRTDGNALTGASLSSDFPESSKGLTAAAGRGVVSKTTVASIAASKGSTGA